MTQETQNARHGLLELALEILRQASSGYPFANQAQLARATGENEANISRWLSGVSTPTLRKLEPVLMTLGVGFTLPGECEPRVPSESIFLPWERKPDSWKILERSRPLPPSLALRVRPDDTSMQPTLQPGDVVVVDTRQKELRSGQVYLVRQPEMAQGACMFRRIFIQERGTLSIVVMTPDNLTDGHEPLILFSYRYGRPVDAIVGRAVQSIRNLTR